MKHIRIFGWFLYHKDNIFARIFFINLRISYHKMLAALLLQLLDMPVEVVVSTKLRVEWAKLCQLGGIDELP